MTTTDRIAPDFLSVKHISTTELQRRLGEPGLVVIDARPTAAYNGWPLPGEVRGGHIRGAAPFPLEWLERVEPARLKPLLLSAGITPAATIVVYGETLEVSTALVEQLADLGYANVLAYAGGFGDWAADPSLPVDRLARYEKLVPPAWVHELITTQTAPTYPGRGFALFHVNFGVPEEYADGHIPGAAHLDTNVLESRVTWNRRSPVELHAALTANGIARDKTIVLYGRDTVGEANEKWPGRRAGQIAAARAAAILLYAGVEDVRLLDGGYDAWVASGLPVETVERNPEPVAAFETQIPGRPDYFADLEEAKAILADPRAVLVSVRTWAEHVGDISGYNYIGPRGRIAGSVWGNCGSDAYHMQHYRNVDNTMRNYHQIAANWQAAGITPDKRVAFYCGTGWRAAETFFYAYLMGWERIAIYDGGWFEWSQDPANPIEVGTP